MKFLFKTLNLYIVCARVKVNIFFSQRMLVVGRADPVISVGGGGGESPD